MVTTSYLDTSAAMKLLVEEAESPALLETLTATPRRLVASWLLHTELHCAGTHAPLRSNEAIHLATALRVGVDEVITYDAELTRAALAAGLRCLAPA